MNNMVNKLLGLMVENPGLPVIPMVDAEVFGEDYGMWLGKWGKCEIAYCYRGNEKMHFKGDDKETVLTDMRDCEYGCDTEGNDIFDLPEEDWNRLYENIPWQKCIIIYIEPYGEQKYNWNGEEKAE